MADQGGQCVCKREGQGGDCEGDEGQNRESGFAERKEGGYCGMFNRLCRDFHKGEIIADKGVRAGHLCDCTRSNESNYCGGEICCRA